MHGFGGDPATTARALKEAGFDAVVSGPAEAVTAVGMEAWLCGGAFGLPSDAPDTMKALDVKGQRRIWFGSGCPNHPELRERNAQSYRKMAQTPGITGILVDGCRFASPASGLDAYLTCFCDICRDKALRLGFSFDRMRRDVGILRDVVTARNGRGARATLWLQSPVGVAEWLTEHPGVLEWLRFRRTCISEHFRTLSEVIHGAGLKMGIYIFTPSVSPFVGQSYVDLSEFTDLFAPMIYRNYPKRPGEACLNWELTIIPEELGLAGTPAEAEAMSLVLSWTGLAAAVPDRTIERVRAALPPEAVGHQTALARALIGPERELAPIIYIDDPDIRETVDLVRANGADGVNYFVYTENWAELVRPAMSR